ncbi:FAD-dependent oxidoreductase [Streptomyces sp. JJ36]|uniref:FAD-dependent oxidoreductase n=1 Tax=Streptomyces sp. JJ36 TaxID=2736645 RepID=UPI001F16DC02|nr:FAD-dependent oxidoreductase [Streptomyces sp. JJ36]MCF6525199.1 FAD-binding oxidoreductase [Streptomyces sp. JJ36]
MREALILGGGVIGLTTAVVLAEDGVRVRVRTREPAEHTTSAVAGGLCWPYRIRPERRALEWAVRSFGVFAGLARAEPAAGVRMVPGTMAGGGVPAEWAELVGPRTVTPLVDMPAYLRYLRDRLEAAGGRHETGAPASPAEVAGEAPVVVNCTGLGARTLVPDPTLVPVRGRLVLVANPGIAEWYVDAGGHSTESCYVLPQPYGLVLGGTAEEGAEDTGPDPAAAEAIRERCARVFPELAEAPVLGHRVGLRPYRPGGVRLETVRRPDGGLLLHHYGHGGAGVTVSWACAREAAALLRAADGSGTEGA